MRRREGEMKGNRELVRRNGEEAGKGRDEKKVERNSMVWKGK